MRLVDGPVASTDTHHLSNARAVTWRADVRHVDAAFAQVTGGTIDRRCPQGDGRDDESEAGVAVRVVIEGAVAQFAEPAEEEDDGGKPCRHRGCTTDGRLRRLSRPASA